MHVSENFRIKVKIKEKDLELIFEEILRKLEVKKLTLKSFIHMALNYPEFIDYFDIFNNKVIKSLNLTILREHLVKFDECLNSLRNIIQEMEDAEESNNVSIALKDYVDKLIIE